MVDRYLAIGYGIALIGSVVLFIAPFSPWYRGASRWMRLVFLLSGLFALAWGLLGFFLLSQQRGQPSELSWPRFWALEHLHSEVGGVGLGLLIALIINPDFWRRTGRGSVSV